MALAEFAVQKKVTITMVTLGIVLLGVIAFIGLPQELFPPITFPQVTIVTDYVNAAPVADTYVNPAGSVSATV